MQDCLAIEGEFAEVDSQRQPAAPASVPCKNREVALIMPSKTQLIDMAKRINTYKALKLKCEETIARQQQLAKEEEKAFNRI